MYNNQKEEGGEEGGGGSIWQNVKLSKFKTLSQGLLMVIIWWTYLERGPVRNLKNCKKNSFKDLGPSQNPNFSFLRY